MSRSARSARRVPLAQTVFLFAVVSAASLVVISCAVTPNRGGTVYGYVRSSSTEAPLSGAVVECDGEWMTVGADGYYELEGIAEGWRSVHAEASGYNDYSEAVNVSGSVRHDVLMDLSVGVSHVYGVVSHSVFGPLEGALVDIDGRTKLTGEDGSYEFWNVPQNADRMTVTLDEYRSYTSPLTLSEDDEEININLLRLASAVIEADADAKVREDTPTVNYGGTDALDLFHGPSLHFRFYIHFPMGSLPPTTVAGACTLRLWSTSGGSNEDPVPTLVAHIAEPWDEMQVTWDDAPEHYVQSSASVVYDDPRYDIDVTSLVSDWFQGVNDNLGFFVDTDYDETPSHFTFASREHEDVELVPTLVLHYAW